MIDPITNLILESDLEKLKEDALDHILEGYDLNCQACGRVISIVKDGDGPLSCCNRRMFVMGSNPVDPSEDIEEVRKSLKGQTVAPDFQVPIKDVDFTPYNQPDAQKKAEEERGKRAKKPFNESQLIKDMEVFQEKGFEKNKKKVEAIKKKISKWQQQKEACPKAYDKELCISRLNQMIQDAKNRIKKLQGKEVKPLPVYGPYSKNSLKEAGFETKPKGWTDKSVKKYGKSLVKGGGTKEGFFDKCVEKMKDKMDNPEGFCASIKDEAHDSTYWRGKGKSPQEVGKDVKKHKNV